MKRALCCFLAAVVIVGCSKPKEETTTSGTLTVLVSEPHLELIQQEATEFQRLYPEAKVTVQGVSTREAIVKMINEGLRCIVIDRPLNEEEQRIVRQAELTVIDNSIANDAFAIVVNSANTTTSISPETLKAITLGKITNWQQVPNSKYTGQIEMCLTGKNSGSYELLMRYFFKAKEDAAPFVLAQSQTEILDYVAAHPQAIGLVSYAVWSDTTRSQIQTAKRNTKIVEVQSKDSTGTVVAVKLNQMNIYNSLYPLKYSLYVYTVSRKAGVADGFATFLANTNGQKIILYSGLVPTRMPYRVVQLTQE
ncbi:MAG: substrate-binding domain-containing protein [Ignavibacteriales bacterium]|nr:substrate-binding domain-containing protein [Ignavibacteriales bacterium]